MSLLIYIPHSLLKAKIKSYIDMYHFKCIRFGFGNQKRKRFDIGIVKDGDPKDDI